MCNLTQLKKAGVSLVNYSTPCLFTAQSALEKEMQRMKNNDASLIETDVNVKNCTELLLDNLAHRR